MCLKFIVCVSITVDYEQYAFTEVWNVHGIHMASGTRAQIQNACLDAQVPGVMIDITMGWYKLNFEVNVSDKF